MSDFFDRPLPVTHDYVAERQRALDALLAAPKTEVLAKSAAIKQAAAFLVDRLAGQGTYPGVVIYNAPSLQPTTHWFSKKPSIDQITGQGWLLATVVHSDTNFAKYEIDGPNSTRALCLQQDGQFVSGVYQDNNRLTHARTLDMSDGAIFDTLGVQGLFCIQLEPKWVHEQDKVKTAELNIGRLEQALLVAGKTLLYD